MPASRCPGSVQAKSTLPGWVNCHTIVPRWPGDANYITVLSGTKVMPQLLGQTRALMAKAWEEV